MTTKDTIPDLLLTSVSRELLLGVEDALVIGAKRAHAAASGMHEGHYPHVLGQLRHFHMNETFQRALATSDASPTPLRGNGIVSGHAGMFRIARFNIRDGIWNNGRRSQTRRQMAKANRAIEPLVQPDLFCDYQRPSEALVFFVACFSGSRASSESPTSIQVAVPDQNMLGWLFRESLENFIKRYDQSGTQSDHARPKLKAKVQIIGK